MTTEILIEKVREKLGSLDTNAEKVLSTAVKILHDDSVMFSAQPVKEKFLSKNITLDEYEKLPRDEKWRYQDNAVKQNHLWVENQLKQHHAKWIMIVNGKVVSYGKTLDDYPEDEDFFALCQKTGKYPFVFFSERVFAIEEMYTRWHSTIEPEDAYPALSIIIGDDNNRFETEADLDTGAVDCYCALEHLMKHNMVKIKPGDLVEKAKHLNRPFLYFIKRVWLELIDESGARRRKRTTIVCFDDWYNSPFTVINPNRTFLLGRSVLFNLQPRIILDFNTRKTELRLGKSIK